MKIIDNNYENWKNQTCSHCFSKLQLDNEDLIYKDDKNSAQYTCPVCHCENGLVIFIKRG